MLLEISYPCIGGLFVLSAQIGAVHGRHGGDSVSSDKAHMSLILIY